MMKIMIFLMVVIALAIMIGSHLFLYFSLVHFYGITSAYIKRWLYYIFLFLSISFILSFILVAVNSNIVTNYFYIFNSYWIALMVNFLWASLLGWAIMLTAKYFSFDPKMNVVATTLILLTIGVVIFGTWNAQNPQLKYLTVKIKNLPPEWQGKTAVHLTDIHAGIINNKEFLEKMVAKLKPIRKDIIFITGDYFDSRDGDFNMHAAPLKDVVAEKGIYYVTGNHEKYVGENHVIPALQSVGVNVLKDEVVTIDGLNIVGIDYPGELQQINAEPVLQKLDPSQANILLFHEPKIIPLAKKYGIDLQLAGHTHRGQLWPFEIFTWMIYGKYEYGLHQDGDYTLYTSSGYGTWGPPIRTGNVPEIVVITLESK